MAKERFRRYASTSDLLVDLKAIAAGSPPLQARRQIDAKVLTRLAHAAEGEEALEPGERATQQKLTVFLVILGAALAVSVFLNIILLVLNAGK